MSVNKIIGSIVYRVRESLDSNPSFRKDVQKYPFHANCFFNDKLNLWHCPGTPNEISSNLKIIGKNLNGEMLKYPSVFNFQSVRQEFDGKKHDSYFNLAIVAPTVDEWGTEERENHLFAPLLRWIYEELINQVIKSGYFHLPFGIPPHSKYEVYTTGGNSGNLVERYGTFIDAIEIHNLKLTLKNLCKNQLDRIDTENEEITKNVLQIINR